MIKNDLADFKECIRCIMNSSVDSSITFNEEGLCSHCQKFDLQSDKRLYKGTIAKHKLKSLVNNIKSSGRNRKYDCLIGVSGGVDSTFVAYLVKKLGLRPLAIHFDNGWNSELAVKNIELVLKNLDIDLYTYVVNWNEFKDLQISFLKSSTPDGEIPTDHGIFASLWRTADKYRIKYIISGMNYSTESMSIPSWSYGHSDPIYIKDVHGKYGDAKLRTYPMFSPIYLFYLTFIRRIKTVSILNYIDYNKEQAMELLQKELGWVNYGGKHHESIYTRFFQGYILPKKYNIDKRYCHFSDLINSGQLSKNEAKANIKLPTYSLKLQKEDKIYVLRKLGLSDNEFEKIMNSRNRTFHEFKNIYRIVGLMKKTVNFLRSKDLYPK